MTDSIRAAKAGVSPVLPQRTFPKFSRLPQEIQDMIWDWSFLLSSSEYHRLREDYDGEKPGDVVFQLYPSMKPISQSQVCRNARLRALRFLRQKGSRPEASSLVFPPVLSLLLPSIIRVGQNPNQQSGGRHVALEPWKYYVPRMPHVFFEIAAGNWYSSNPFRDYSFEMLDVVDFSVQRILLVFSHTHEYCGSNMASSRISFKRPLDDEVLRRWLDKPAQLVDILDKTTWKELEYIFGMPNRNKYHQFTPFQTEYEKEGQKSTAVWAFNRFWREWKKQRKWDKEPERKLMKPYNKDIHVLVPVRVQSADPNKGYTPGGYFMNLRW